MLARLGPADAEAASRLHAENLSDFPTTPATEPQRYTTDDLAGLLGAAHAIGAWQAGALLALTVVQRTGSSAETAFTVTDRAARGRGLATAVKAQSVLDLAAQGVTRFATGGRR